MTPLFHCPATNRASAGWQLTRIGPDQFVHPNRDGLGTLGVVTQRENWLIAQVSLVYLDEPDESAYDTRRGDLLKKNLTD
jgi:hypothetical protein